MLTQPHANTKNRPEVRTEIKGRRIRKIRKSLATTVRTVAGIALLWLPCAAFADEVVLWPKVVGIIQGGNEVGTGTGKVTGGGQPWFARSGSAAVDLSNGALQFQVQGLVLAGGNTIGTPGAVTQVKGTLVCDTTGSLTGNSTLVDTALVNLSPQGDARFAGQVGPLPAACVNSPNIAFLIRTAGGAWIAAGEVREVGNSTN